MINSLSKCLIVLTLLIVSTFIMAKDNLRVISYNVQGLPKPIKLSHRKLKKIPKAILKYDADVIAFQETFTRSAKVLARIPGYPYYSYGNKTRKFKINSGLLIVSKYPITNRRTIQYSKCTGTDCFARKGALMVTIKLPNNKEVDIINTHLNAGSNKATKWHQLDELEKFLKTYASDRTVVLLGDFNFKARSMYYDYLNYFSPLKDTHQQYVNNNLNLSMYEKNAHTFSLRSFFGYAIKPKKIDFVWLQNKGRTFLKTVKSKVIFDNRDSKKLSDHFGLLVDFSLQ